MHINDTKNKLYVWIFYIPRVLLGIVLSITLVKSNEVVRDGSVIVSHYVKQYASVCSRGAELRTVGSFSG